MVNIDDSKYLALGTPYDAKLCNYYFAGTPTRLIIQTIQQYLLRVTLHQRPVGTPVTMLLPKAGYALLPSYLESDLDTILVNFDTVYYAFIGGRADINFVEIDFKTHLPVTINPLNAAMASIDEDQVLTFATGYLVAQFGHGFTVGTPIRLSGLEWIKTCANSRTNAGTVGIVSEIIDADHFKYLISGLLPGIYVEGADYFLSTATFGNLMIVTDATEWSVGQVYEFIGTGTAEGLLIEIDLGHEIVTQYFHPPVTISADSVDKASIDENQVITIKKQGINTTTNRLEYGTVTWLHDLVFLVSECGYYIQGNYYTSPSVEITLSAADVTNPRIDLFFVDVNSLADVLKGTAAAIPIEGNLDPYTQLEIKAVTVTAGATAPPDINEEIIFNENVEWLAELTIAKANASVNFNDVNSPFTGTKQTRVTFLPYTFGGILFTYSRELDINISGSNLILSVRTSRAFMATESIYLKLLDVWTVKSQAVYIKDGLYGFNSSITGYQTLTIPFADFKATTTLINVIRFGFTSSGAGLAGNTTVDFDMIKIQKGAAIVDYTETDPIFLEWLANYNPHPPVTVNEESAAFGSIGDDQVFRLTQPTYAALPDKPVIPTAYTLPTATPTVLGGVKIGARLTIAGGILSADVQASGSNNSVQTLSGLTPVWNGLLGINAKITISGNTTITLSNLVAGESGNLTVTNPATVYTLTVSGYTNKISPSVYSATNVMLISGGSIIDMYSWYYDGTYLVWNGSQEYK